MSKVHEPERDPLDPLGQVVDRFGWSVGDVGAMPRADLAGPSGDRAPEASDFDGHAVVGEVAADLSDRLDGKLVAGVVVDLAHNFLRVASEPHLPGGVTSTEETEQLVVLVVGEHGVEHGAIRR